jgi:hypothetical protein
MYYVVDMLSGAGGAISTAASTTTIVVETPQIDLSGGKIAVPLTVKADKNVNPSIVLMNNGNISASGSLAIEISASPDGMLSDATVVKQLTRRINLKPGKSMKIQLSGVIAPAAAGSYTFFINVDPQNTFSDVNVANIMLTTIPVTVQ